MEDNVVSTTEIEAGGDPRPYLLRIVTTRSTQNSISPAASNLVTTSSATATAYSEESPLLARHQDDTFVARWKSRPLTDTRLGTVSIWRKPSISFLLPPFLLYCLAMGAVNVPKLNVILTLICYQNDLATHHLDPGNKLHASDIFRGDPSRCQNPQVHVLLGRFQLYANLISGTLCAFMTPKLGALSDRYGRKGILAITAMGMLLGDVITILAASFPDQISVNWVLVEFGFGGLCGAFIATMALMQSYASDCTPAAKRSAGFGYMHGCMYAGTALGPLLGGLVIKAADNILVIFYAAFACHLFFILFVIFVIPESLSKERQFAAREKHRRQQAQSKNSPQTWAAATSMASVLSPIKILRPSPDKSTATVRKNLILLSASDTIVFGITLGSTSIAIMYSEYFFGWGTFEASVFVTVANTCRVGALVLILPLVVRVFASRTRRSSINPNTASDMLDIAVIRVGIFFDVLGYVGYALAPTGSLYILSGIVASIGGIASPTLQSILTRHVSSERTGELLGALGFLHAVARIIAPAILNLLYSLTVGKMSQAVFWCLAATFGVAFGASLGIVAHSPEEATSVLSNSNQEDGEEDGRQ